MGGDSKAQVLCVRWERRGKECEVEIFGAGASAALIGGASIEVALRLLRTLPLIDAFGPLARKVVTANAAKDDILERAEMAMSAEAPQGEIVFCSRSTREEIAAILGSWRQFVARTT
jgi:hypothetical protein